MDDGVLSVAETAAYLKADEAFVRRLVRDKTIPFVRLGPRKVVVPRKALDDWLYARANQNLTSGTGAPVLGLVAEQHASG